MSFFHVQNQCNIYIQNSGSDDSDDEESSEEDCRAKIKTACQEEIVGTRSRQCGDFIVVEAEDTQGNVCSDDGDIEDNGADEEEYNALINGEQSIIGTLQVFEELDPYVKWSLFAIMITFVGLMIIACYICVARKGDNTDDDRNKDNLQDEINAMGKASSWNEYGNIKQTDLNEEDEDDEECYFSDKGQTHQQINTVADSDEEDEENGIDGDETAIEMMKAVSN